MAANPTIYQRWARERNYVKFQLNGMAGAMNHILSIKPRGILTFKERFLIHMLSNQLKKILESWEDNHQESRQKYTLNLKRTRKS